MTYQSKCDAVAAEIEERKILEIEEYGLVMSTHHLFLERGTFGSFRKEKDDYFGHPAELVAFVGKAGSGYEGWTGKLGLIGQCRVDFIYYENQFLMYDLPAKVLEVIKEKGVPFSDYDHDHEGKLIVGTAVRAYHFSDNMPKSEGYALVQTLNDGFRKARNIFREKIDAKAKAEREEKEGHAKWLASHYRDMKEL